MNVLQRKKMSSDKQVAMQAKILCLTIGAEGLPFRTVITDFNQSDKLKANFQFYSKENNITDSFDKREIQKIFNESEQGIRLNICASDIFASLDNTEKNKTIMFFKDFCEKNQKLLNIKGVFQLISPDDEAIFDGNLNENIDVHKIKPFEIEANVLINSADKSQSSPVFNWLKSDAYYEAHRSKNIKNLWRDRQIEDFQTESYHKRPTLEESPEEEKTNQPNTSEENYFFIENKSIKNISFIEDYNDSTCESNIVQKRSDDIVRQSVSYAVIKGRRNDWESTKKKDPMLNLTVPNCVYKIIPRCVYTALKDTRDTEKVFNIFVGSDIILEDKENFDLDNKKNYRKTVPISHIFSTPEEADQVAEKHDDKKDNTTSVYKMMSSEEKNQRKEQVHQRIKETNKTKK